MKTIWICGIYRKPNQWEIVGVFDSEEKALTAASNDKLCFIGPMELNKDYGVETLPNWPGSYYPAAEGKTND